MTLSLFPDLEAPDRDVLISIQPVYVDKILAREKTVELRRKFPLLPEGTRLWIYASSPVCAVLAQATLRDVDRKPLPSLWQKYGQAAQSGSKEAFFTYFNGLEEGFALLLEDVQPMARPVPLATLREAYGITPPQSYRYLEKGWRWGR